MKATFTALLSAALLAGPSVAHSAIKPPAPDRALTPNSSDAPAGCKLLASDKGYPADDVWAKALPGVYKKLKGTEAPDFMHQAKSVEDVQAAVNFAREHNVRLTIITSGHDFGGRETGRSGLRLDMAALREPTVFSQDWKCGDVLKPTNTAGKIVEEVEVCKVKKSKRVPSPSNALRDHEYRFFEKREGHNCESLLKLAKRHGPDCDPINPAVPCLERRQTEGHSMEGMAGMEGHGAGEVPQYNVIKAAKDRPAYARIAAGTYNELFYTQAHESGLMTAGAQHGGVGVLGGWSLAGGHNPFGTRIGMQVDNLMEIEVVTADGKFQKVSECNNPELYWALRGGGGSTFGVVTGATVKVHPTFPVVVSRFFVNSTSMDGNAAASAYFLKQGNKLRDEHGLMGYFYIYPNGFQSVLHMPAEFATLDNAKKVTEPLMAEMERLANAKHIPPQYYEHKSYKDWYTAEMGDEEMEESGAKFLSYYDGSDGSVPSASDAMMNPLILLPWALKFPAGAAKRDLSNKDMAAMAVMRSQAMSRTYLDSRLLSDKHVQSVSQEELAQAIKKTFPMTDGNHFRGFLYGGGEQAKPDKDAMGLLPEWRDAVYHFIINAVPGNIRHDFDIGPIAKLFPTAAGYVNEASPGEKDWKKVYWGSHYEKLETIKKKYDPTNVFWCSPCVGADMLKYDDERLCKNAAYPEVGPAPQTYPNKNSTIGIAAMPGVPGIPNPLLPIVQAYMQNKTIPAAMPKSKYFKIAMGEGGSAGGKFADMDPYHPGQKLEGPAAPIHPPSPAQTGVGAKPNEAPGAAGAANENAGASPAPAPAPDAAPARAPSAESSALSTVEAAPNLAAVDPATANSPKLSSPKAPKGVKGAKGGRPGRGSRPPKFGSSANLANIRTGYVDESSI